MTPLDFRQGYEAYHTFQSLKLHFGTVRYNFVEYNGKSRICSYDEFCFKPEAIFFSKLADKGLVYERILANMLDNPKIYIRDILISDDIYLAWKKRTDGLTYLFTQELNVLESNYPANFVSFSGYPPILMKFLQKKISPETFTILSNISGAIPVWEKTADAVTKPLIFKAKKYHMLLDYDRAKIKAAVKNHFDF